MSDGFRDAMRHMTASNGLGKVAKLQKQMRDAYKHLYKELTPEQKLIEDAIMDMAIFGEATLKFMWDDESMIPTPRKVPEVNKKYCSHDWVLYTGLNEQFYHCKHCGEKK